jgi:hypothetical protein
MAHTAHVEDFFLEQGCCYAKEEEKEFLKEARALSRASGKSLGVSALHLMLKGEGFFNIFSGLSESERFEMINFIFSKKGIKERI